VVGMGPWKLKFCEIWGYKCPTGGVCLHDSYEIFIGCR